MKKTVRIKFVGFWKDFNPESNIIYRVLKKHYNVVITEDPDYIICSVFGKPYEYCKYPQVRIMYSGENYFPDMNLVDYGISPYPVEFFDRLCYRPACFDSFDRFLDLQTKDRNYPDEILAKKVYFANFIAGHESEYGIRGDFFKKLSEYKRVESPGKYLNNMPDGETVSWLDNSKFSFQKKCKFTLCFESTKHEGFITEKITDAFFSDTIPVYYGSSDVTDIFNPKAFINCEDPEEAIKQIIEIDNDDKKYIEMLRQPIFNDNSFPETIMNNIESFIINIFEQPLDKAYRRSRVYAPLKHNDYLSKAELPQNFSTKQLIKLCLKRVFKINK